MADGPEPGITDESGAALAVADGDAPGGAVVQSCGDAKCGPCEGGPTCCICVDVDQADPAKPCWPPYGVPRDRWCNGANKCCCGTRVRATWSRMGRYFRRTDTPGVGFKQFDGTWEETAVFEVAVKRDADGKCVGFEYTYLKYDWRNYNHTLTESKESETIQENHDPASIKNFLLGKMGNPQVLCRPEPVELAVALLGGGNSPYAPNTGDGDWAKLFLADGCNGERKEEDLVPPVTFTNITRWRSRAGCRTMEITAEVDNEFANQFSSGTEDVTQTVTMQLEVLEDECCPPDGPGGPHGSPYNPAPDLVPLDPRDPENPGSRDTGNGKRHTGYGTRQTGGGCLRCGEAMKGDKCFWCGWCVSCGG